MATELKVTCKSWGSSAQVMSRQYYLVYIKIAMDRLVLICIVIKICFFDADYLQGHKVKFYTHKTINRLLMQFLIIMVGINMHQVVTSIWFSQIAAGKNG